MISSFPSMFVELRIPARTVCFASAINGINTEQLREQLNHLHKEEETIRAKVSSARLRLMRLSEAAEKLRQHAAVSVQNGNDNYARELLFQKKKVMQAMEKSKDRIELLDELSAKLNEMLSFKENQLIGTVASELEVSRGTAPAPVRTVSPKAENDIAANSIQHSQDDELKECSEGIKLHNYEDLKGREGSVEENIWDQSSKEQSSFKEFLEHVDGWFNKIEDELNSFLRVSALVLDSKKILESSKVEQVMEILEDVQRIRVRIARIMHKEQVS